MYSTIAAELIPELMAQFPDMRNKIPGIFNRKLINKVFNGYMEKGLIPSDMIFIMLKVKL